MNLEQIMDMLKTRERLAKNITHWAVIPEKPVNMRPFGILESKLISALKKKGIHGFTPAAKGPG